MGVPKRKGQTAKSTPVCCFVFDKEVHQQVSSLDLTAFAGSSSRSCSDGIHAQSRWVLLCHSLSPALLYCLHLWYPTSYILWQCFSRSAFGHSTKRMTKRRLHSVLRYAWLYRTCSFVLSWHILTLFRNVHLLSSFGARMCNCRQGDQDRSRGSCCDVAFKSQSKVFITCQGNPIAKSPEKHLSVSLSSTLVQHTQHWGFVEAGSQKQNSCRWRWRNAVSAAWLYCAVGPSGSRASCGCWPKNRKGPLLVGFASRFPIKHST